MTDVPGGPPPAAKRPAHTGTGGPTPARQGPAPGDTGTRRARRAVTTTYRVEKPAKAGPLAVAGKVVVAAVFVATAALAVYRADRPAATPHKLVPDVILTGGWALVALLAVVLTAAALAWVRHGSRFADALVFAILWPIATVLMAIVAALSLVPQHYLRPGPVLAPAGIAAVVMMVAVAVVYNRAPRR